MNSNMKPKITSFVATIEDANDGSGDGILTFPPEFIEQVGWKEGDTLSMSVENNNLVIKLVSTTKKHDKT